MPRSLVASRQLCQQGVAAIEEEQWERAESLLAEAVRTCPFDPDARRHYAEVLWRRGQRERAIAELEEAGQLAVDNACLRVRLSEMRLAAGQVELARHSAEHALDLDPKLAQAWAARARVMRAGGELEEALADYHRALSLAPDDPAVLLQMAELYRELNEPQRALAALQNLAEMYSPGEEPQQVLLLQGLAYAALGRWEDAAGSLSTAATRDRPTPEILFHLARAELLAGRPAAAAAAARHALALDPRHLPSRELLEHVKVVLGPQDTLRR